VALVAAGGTAGCGRLAGRGQDAAPAGTASAPAAPAGSAAAGATTRAGAGAASGPAVDPATVTRVEQQVDGAQRFLDGAEAELGQDPG
jgi:hypothetical protein